MFQLYENTTIYIFCPSDTKTGGPESLHQLAEKLKAIGHKSKIIYIPKVKDKLFKLYEEYDFDSADEVIDSAENIIIVPEIWPEKINNYKFIQKAIWWLSVDNYRKASICCEPWKAEILYKCITKLFPSIYFDELFNNFKRKPMFTFKSPRNSTVVHLAGSDYAYSFLLKKKAQCVLHLSSGPISSPFREEESTKLNKENIVLYNPAKGKKLVDRLIKSDSTLKWIPIQNMTSSEIKKLMLKSKVYVDFGPFPGKERLPREAVLCNCCIIVGKRGAGNFYQNVPFPAKYKFDVVQLKNKEVISCIKDCLNDYESHVDDFQQFKRLTLKEKEFFELQIEQIFGVKT